jgi:FAD/FMN-containing dehydrogenase
MERIRRSDHRERSCERRKDGQSYWHRRYSLNEGTLMVGLIVGGGYGWLTGQYGLAVDNLVEATVIAADGRIVKASANENPDLFWAIKGRVHLFRSQNRRRIQFWRCFGICYTALFPLHEMLWRNRGIQPRQAGSSCGCS